MGLSPGSRTSQGPIIPADRTFPTGFGLVRSAVKFIGLAALIVPPSLPVSWKSAIATATGSLPALLVSRTRFADLQSILSTEKLTSAAASLIASFGALVECRN